MRRSFFIPALVVLLLVALTIPPSAQSQDLQYSSTTKLELSGAAGRAVNFISRLTGNSNETTETVYLKGNRMRTDDEGSSTILDLDAKRFVILNHENKTYTVMPFSDMAQMAEEMTANMEEAMREAQSEMSEEDRAAMRRAQEDEDVEIEYDLKVERTGEMRDIRGHRAERVLMIMTARGKQKVEQEGEEEDLEGSLVLANELWLTSDNAGELEQMFAFQEQMGQSMTESFSGMNSHSMDESFSAAFASDPRMGEMMANAAEEMAKLEGYPLISVMKVVMVPGDLEFDSELAFGDAEEEKEEVSTAQRAGRMARSFMRGRLGRGNDDEPKEEEPRELKQSTLLTATTEISDVQNTALGDDMFAVPADYEERTLATMHE